MLASTILSLNFIYVNDNSVNLIYYNSHNWNHLVKRKIHVATTIILQSIIVDAKRILMAIKNVLFISPVAGYRFLDLLENVFESICRASNSY